MRVQSITRPFLHVGLTVATVLVTLRIANAVPGGETRPALSFSGTLTGASGPQTLRFVFRRPMVTTPVCEGSATVNPGSAGQFTASIPIDACPATLFDGSDVVFDVAVGGTPIATDQAINPVPYARYADRVGTPDCPVGYNRDVSATGIVLCQKPLSGGRFDQVVRVGGGASAFWVDRYEASVWRSADASGVQIRTPEAYPLPSSGEVTPGNEIYAASVAGVPPSAFVSWFQAVAACRLSGKALPTNEEWRWAAMGTPDEGASTGSGGSCVLNGPPQVSGGRSRCASRWGSEDHSGNVFEMVTEWVQSNIQGLDANRWPPGFPNDTPFWSSVATAGVEGVESNRQLPSVLANGGFWGSGSAGGIYSWVNSWSVASRNPALGFRCVIRR